MYARDFRIATSVALVASACWFTPRTVRAQTLDATQAAVRRTMIDDAQRAQSAGQFAQCAELASRALSMQDTGSLRRLVAECQLSSGSVVEALGNAELCLSVLRRDERAPGREQHLAACDQVARSARARTTRLTVRVPSPEPAGLEITVAGRVLPRVQWNIATIAPTGALEIVATATGRAAFRRTLTASSEAPAEVQVVFEEAPASSGAAANHGANAAAGAATTGNASNTNAPNEGSASAGGAGANGGAPHDASDPRTPVPSSPRGSSGRPLVVAGGAMFGVGVVVGVVGFVVPAAMLGGYTSRCSGAVPDAVHAECAREASASQPVADAMTGVGFAGMGLAAVGAGLMVFGLTRPAPASERVASARVEVAPWFFGRSGAGFSVRSAF